MQVMIQHAIRLEGTRFWVQHRRRTYGPFDYEWSSDFAGVELRYAGQKFGEYCSRDEVFADLKPYHLPMSVVNVTTIVIGCIVYGVLNGLSETERLTLVESRLSEFGYSRFRPSMD